MRRVIGLHRFGWRRDLPDFRDRKFHPTLSRGAQPIDLRPLCPPVYDQLALGSCTANLAAFALQFDAMKQGIPAPMSSRLFIYWNERNDQGDTTDDTGASIREAYKAINAYGACREDAWPYDIAKFAMQPPAQCFADALKDRAVTYESVAQDLDHLRGALEAGLPIGFGFTVYESFESDAVEETGIVPMPLTTEAALGGHANAIVGDLPDQNRFIVRNSWGAGWGDQGYDTMPYDYLLNPDLAADFWVAQTVSAAG